MKVLKYMEERVAFVSPHRLFANCDMFVRSIIYPIHGQKGTGIVSFPDDGSFAQAWAALVTTNGLPPHIVNYLKQDPQESDRKKEFQTLVSIHKQSFVPSTGESSVGPIPPDQFTVHDLWLGPTLCMTRFLKANKMFNALPTQIERYKRSKNASFNIKGNSTEASKTFRKATDLPSPNVFLSYMGADEAFDSLNDAAYFHRTNVWKYRLKYLAEAALLVNDGLMGACVDV